MKFTPCFQINSSFGQRQGLLHALDRFRTGVLGTFPEKFPPESNFNAEQLQAFVLLTLFVNSQFDFLG